MIYLDNLYTHSVAVSKFSINLLPISINKSFIGIYHFWIFFIYLDADNIYNSDIDFNVNKDLFSNNGWSFIYIKNSSIVFYNVFKYPDIVVSF